MSRPWRRIAILLFTAAVLFGGVAGEELLASDPTTQEELRLLTEVLQTAHEGYGEEVLYRDLVYGSIDGMLRALDPHTSFLSPESYEDMRQRQQGSFYGLGILVSMRDGQLTVISPLEGTPAWRLGLRAGDIITTIEGEGTDTMALDEAVNKLKGPKDTEVTITIARRGLEEPLELTITRAEIPQATVRYAYMLRPDTGYIRLTDFSRSTAQEMRDAVAKLRGEGMEHLVLDLRSNGGGLLDQTIEVSNLFVPAGSKIVETRGRTGDSKQSWSSDADSEPLDVPVVVLVNNGTASAAEILAGAIQDHDVGLVLGTPTWGKGLVQTVYNLSYGAGIALTTAQYYTPSGRLIQRDYSSYFDYYTHFNQEQAAEAGTEPEVAPESPEFATDTGRVVYGGGGITPDLFVDLPDTPPLVAYLYARNAFFDFAVDYDREHDITDTSWQPPAGTIEQFRDWLVSEELVDDPADLESVVENEEVREMALRQIRADLFTSSFGTEASHKVIAEGDAQIQAALDSFDEAAQLLAQRYGLEGQTPPSIHLGSPETRAAESYPDDSLN